MIKPPQQPPPTHFLYLVIPLRLGLLINLQADLLTRG